MGDGLEIWMNKSGGERGAYLQGVINFMSLSFIIYGDWGNRLMQFNLALNYCVLCLCTCTLPLLQNNQIRTGYKT